MLARRFPWGVAVSMAGLLIGAKAAAQVQGAPAPVPDTAQGTPGAPAARSVTPDAPSRHGLFLGASLGLGELHFGYGPHVFWGRSTPIALSAGGALTRNLILFGQVYDAHVFGPSSTYGELSDLNLIGVGPGLKYYLGSTDLFLSGSLMISKFHFGIDAASSTSQATDESTNWGATFRLALGKSWQTSRRWSLGLEGEVLYGRMTYPAAEDGRGTVKSFSLLVSAAYGHDPVDPGPRMGLHADGGNFVIESRGGLGHLWTRYGVDFASGTIVPLELSVGLLFTPRLAVMADAAYARMPDLNAGLYPALQSARSHGFGLRAKYYLQPRSTFVAAAFGYTHFSFSNPAPYYTPGSQTGVAAHVTVGKEWWLLRHWAIGVAGDLLLGAVEGGEDGLHVPKALSLLALLAYSSSRGDGPAGTSAVGDVLAAPAVAAEVERPSAAPAAAQETAPAPVSPEPAPATLAAPGPRPRQGFHAGARLGAGWLALTGRTSSGNGDFRIHGFGTPFALSAGWALTHDWVVFGEFFEHRVRRPETNLNESLVDVDLLAVGPGVTYHGLPAGLFLSTALWLSQVSYRNDSPLDTRYGTNATSHWGYSGRLSVGEEWRVSSYWGLGVAVEATLGRMNDSSFGANSAYTVKTLSALAIANFD